MPSPSGSAVPSLSGWRRFVSQVADELAGHLRRGGRVVLAGVPQVGEFPVLPQPLRAVLGNHATALDHELARIAASREHVEHLVTPGLGDPGTLSTDNFHPSESGYQGWAAGIADALGLLR